jgi:hypothetical protein
MARAKSTSKKVATEPSKMLRDDQFSKTVRTPDAHKPGDPHQYKLICEVCGEHGTIRVSVDPETEMGLAPSRCNCPESGTSGSCPFHDSSTKP